jgi:hypothetical protein
MKGKSKFRRTWVTAVEQLRIGRAGRFLRMRVEGKRENCRLTGTVYMYVDLNVL